MNLEKFEEEYKEFQKKYDLPKFDSLVDVFEIDKTNKDTKRILREIRKTMVEKIVNYMRLIELILNPSQASPIFMVFLREINAEDKNNLNKVLKEFGLIDLRSLELDIESDEKKEAEEIKYIFNAWNKVLNDLKLIIKMMERNWNGANIKKEKGYFG